MVQNGRNRRRRAVLDANVIDHCVKCHGRKLNLVVISCGRGSVKRRRIGAEDQINRRIAPAVGQNTAQHLNRQEFITTGLGNGQQTLVGILALIPDKVCADRVCYGAAVGIIQPNAINALQLLVGVIVDIDCDVLLVGFAFVVLISMAAVFIDGILRCALAVDDLYPKAQLQIQRLVHVLYAEVNKLSVQFEQLQCVYTGHGEGRLPGPRAAGRAVAQRCDHLAAVGADEAGLHGFGHLFLFVRGKLYLHGFLIAGLRGVYRDLIIRFAPDHACHSEALDLYLRNGRQRIVHAVHADITQVVRAGRIKGIAAEPRAILLLCEGHCILARALRAVDSPNKERRHGGRICAVHIHKHIRGQVFGGDRVVIVHGVFADASRHRAGLINKVIVADGLQIHGGAELQVQLPLDLRGGKHVVIGQQVAIEVNNGGDTLGLIRIQRSDGSAFPLVILLIGVCILRLGVPIQNQRHRVASILGVLLGGIHVGGGQKIAVLIHEHNLHSLQQAGGFCLVVGRVGIEDIAAAAALRGALGCQHALFRRSAPNTVHAVVAQDLACFFVLHNGAFQRQAGLLSIGAHPKVHCHAIGVLCHHIICGQARPA